MPAYEEQFAVGTIVRVGSRSQLEDFQREWQWHNKLQPEQLAFADVVATVKSVGFYHGGDVLYTLDGVPGVWHEPCLARADQT